MKFLLGIIFLSAVLGLLTVLADPATHPNDSSHERISTRSRPRAAWHHRRAPTPYKNGGRTPEEYQLPSAVIPEHYEVWLTPYLTSPANKKLTFDGKITVLVAISTPTPTVVMHSWDLNIAHIEVIKASIHVDVDEEADGSPVPVASHTLPKDDRQFLTIELDEDLIPGQKYEITIEYSGMIHDDFGFLWNLYQDASGNDVWLGVTDMEPNGARRVMPCFDEPGLKALFKVYLAKEPGRELLANMPLLGDAGDVDPIELPGWIWSEFLTTFPMSTYLFAVATHQMASKTASGPGNSGYKVWTRTEIVDQADYSVNSIPEVIRYFQRFTDIPYTLDKLDNIGLISFNSGAMENWGLITYKEQYLVFVETRDTTWEKQLVIQLLAHEIAHQWYGNLVSPRWWSDLWLNEGFATYFEYWGSTAIGSDWQMDEQFIVDMMYSAFRADADTSTHPIHASYVDSPSSINNIFDSITYNKGGCLVRFMVNLLGEAKFKIGINDYLTQMQYKASHQDILFDVLGQQVPPLPPTKTFSDVMHTWTLQAGFPLVTVTRDYDADAATVTQERFGGGSERWIIPLMWTTADVLDFTDLTPRTWLLPEDANVMLNVGSIDTQWIMFNPQQTVFYRVNYDITNWNLILNYMADPVNVPNVHPMNRAQLMDDAMALASVGRLDYTTALQTTHYLGAEDRLLPWLTATDSLEYIMERMYQTAEGVDLFQSYLSSRIELAYVAVNGFNWATTDPHVTLLLRWHITRWACDMDNVVCNDDAFLLFRIWQIAPDPDINNPIRIDHRTPAYCAGQRRGGNADYEFMKSRYSAATDPDESTRLLLGMGCATDQDIIQRFLDESLTTEIRPGDALNVLDSVANNPLGVDLALDFVINNWVALDPLYGNIGYGFSELEPKLNTQEHYNKISQFRSQNAALLGAANNALILGVLNKLEGTIAWNFANLETVMNYFRTAMTRL